MELIDTPTPPRLIFGAGVSRRVGACARELGGQRVLLVTDAGLLAAGHVAGVQASLEAAGCAVTVFSQVRENPTTRDVDNACAAARAASADLIVGLGGGSAMDTAKGANFLLSNGGVMRDYWGVGKAAQPMLPFLAIPTTAGTGSETQSAALIADEATHQKMACLDPKATARIALLDPALTLSLPPRVTALSGVDALTHAVETAVTARRTGLSLGFSHRAFRLLTGAFPQVLATPDCLHARGDMLLGASLAGLAIEHSMLGAAHAAANPLTARHNVIHGLAVGLMLLPVVRWNARQPGVRGLYADLAASAGLSRPQDGPDAALDRLLEALHRLLDQAGLPASLSELGVTRPQIPALAAEAAQQWTARFNPVPIAQPGFEELYSAALSPR